MSTLNYTFAYSVGDNVVIKQLNTVGTVRAVQLNKNGTQYEIVYFWSGRQQAAWVYIEDLGTPPEVPRKETKVSMTSEPLKAEIV